MALLRALKRIFGKNTALLTQDALRAPGKETILLGQEIQKEIRRLYGGAVLRIRTVDAGSSGAEEVELKALTNSYYDMEQFGLRFVSSPRHADMLFVTGPVTRNMEAPLKEAYDAVPQPCIVVAVGDGACTGGVWNESYAVIGPVEKVIPVHAKIPGDPPTPEDILRGMLHILEAANARV
jgi:Ni,Fe-hydrogenase III small subunit